MFPIPSIGLAELIILAGSAGLVTLIAAIVVVAIVRSRRKSDTHRPAETGLHELEATGKETRRSWKWIAILALLVLIVLPLFVIVFGVLWVTPVKQRMSTSGPGTGPTVQAVIVAVPTATPLPALTASGVTPTNTLLPTSTPGATSTDTPQLPPTSTGNPSSALLSLNPFSELTMFVILPAIAGLVLLGGMVIVAAVLRKWQESDAQLKDTDINRDDGGARAKIDKLRYALLTFTLWIALSVFLVFDLDASVSVYFKFTAAYAAFWVLVGALLLHSRPMREKVLILGLFLMIVFSVRFIDWNSRKPFLKDLYSIQEGMTPAQVEQIMGGYRIGGGSPFPDGPETELNEQGEIVTGGITYLHTDEGWGNSDWGVVIFENGRVVRVEFLPD